MRRAQALSEEPFLKFDRGEPLASEEKRNLKLASFQFEGMAAFNPKLFSAYFGAGKCYFILDEFERAADRFERAATFAPLDRPEGRLTAAEAKHLASKCYERLGRFDLAADSAKTSVDLVPEAPHYHSQWASSELELGNEAEAKKHLAKALELDPNDKRARQLERLLKLTDRS